MVDGILEPEAAVDDRLKPQPAEVRRVEPEPAVDDILEPEAAVLEDVREDVRDGGAASFDEYADSPLMEQADRAVRMVRLEHGISTAESLQDSSKADNREQEVQSSLPLRLQDFLLCRSIRLKLTAWQREWDGATSAGDTSEQEDGLVLQEISWRETETHPNGAVQDETGLVQEETGLSRASSAGDAEEDLAEIIILPDDGTSLDDSVDTDFSVQSQRTVKSLTRRVLRWIRDHKTLTAAGICAIIVPSLTFGHFYNLVKDFEPTPPVCAAGCPDWNCLCVGVVSPALVCRGPDFVVHDVFYKATVNLGRLIRRLEETTPNFNKDHCQCFCEY